MAITHWAERAGVTVVAWHLDQGVSGAADLADRPALSLCLNELATQRAGLLVIARRDRLARDVVIAATIERAALANGARVLSADGVGNGDSPADQFMRTILDGAAAYERALIRARTRAALRARRAQNKRAGNVPWGFEAIEDGTLREHPSERAVVVRALALRQSGASLRTIVRTLEAEGFASRSAQPLRLTQIARILKEHQAA
jgi:DNA invertase Pin-like site-specific DNA recombinase